MRHSTAILSMMCALFPGALCAPGSAQAQGADDELRIMTFNAWGLPQPIAVDRRGRFPKIASFLEETRADVVGLQEVWRGALGLLPLQGLRTSDSRGDSGLALYSPHPMDGIAFEAFEAERGFDALKGKGVLRAKVDLPSVGPVDVYVTHLQAGGGDRNARVRAAQVDQMLELVGDSGPALVMGDFNLYFGNELDERTWGRLRDEGLVDVAHSLGNTDPTYSDSLYRFDQVYVRSGGTYRLAPAHAQVYAYDDDPTTADPERLSDHLPLLVRLKMLLSEEDPGR